MPDSTHLHPPVSNPADLGLDSGLSQKTCPTSPFGKYNFVLLFSLKGNSLPGGRTRKNGVWAELSIEPSEKRPQVRYQALGSSLNLPYPGQETLFPSQASPSSEKCRKYKKSPRNFSPKFHQQTAVNLDLFQLPESFKLYCQEGKSLPAGKQHPTPASGSLPPYHLYSVACASSRPCPLPT